MNQVVRSAILIAGGLALAACSDSQNTTYPALKKSVSADRAGAMVGFGFNGTASGFPTGVVNLTGGGSYDPATATNALSDQTIGHGSGGFSCVSSVQQLNLNGCEAGQGVRWDTAQLLASTPFKCTGAITEPGKNAVTNEHTVVLLADFYRAGDANNESFKAKIIVADHDLDDVREGIQNIWIQGVGCGTGTVNFSQRGGSSVN